MEFEWDQAKAASNIRKHGIGFRDASSIFDGPLLERPDKRRDYGEPRFVAIGIAVGKVLKVVYTQRGLRVRIISAWRANRHEARAYRALYPGSDSEDAE